MVLAVANAGAATKVQTYEPSHGATVTMADGARQDPVQSPRGSSTAASLVARRVDLPCTSAGFAPPPSCCVHIKFIPNGERWTLLALTDPGLPPTVARWLESFGPAEINIAPGIAPKVLRANFEKLPDPWHRMVSTVVVRYVQLTPQGSASIFVEDSPERVERFVGGIRGGSPGVRVRRTSMGPGRVKLTARQLEVISLAVALGYYEVPHKLTLRILASKLGLSVGAVSELLGRAEALIVTNYTDTLSESSWSMLGALN